MKTTRRPPHTFAVKAQGEHRWETFQVTGSHNPQARIYKFQLLYRGGHLRRMEKALEGHRNPRYCSQEAGSWIGKCHLHLYDERPPHHKCAVEMPQLENLGVIDALHLFFEICNLRPFIIEYQDSLFGV